MISSPDREKAISLIKEAVHAGCRLTKACKELGLTERTYYRWIKEHNQAGVSADRRPGSVHPNPANKLSSEEKQAVLDVCHSEEFASMPPCEIVPTLADKGVYLASESSFYRILREEGEQHHRGRSGEPTHRTITTHKATGPNQVWMWDITYLNGPVKGQFYYLYLISDLFSRDIVGWEVWEEQNDELASVLITRTCLAQGILSTRPLVLHSDNGSPMKGATMLETLYKLGITPSNSRPRVSNDNPYAESLFKTLKYRPNYQPNGFATLEEARKWCSEFVEWYRNKHHHSGIKFVTPAQRHSGEAEEILQKRHELYEKAKSQHPLRWNGRATRDWTLPTEVYLNPDRQDGKSTINDNTSQVCA